MAARGPDGSGVWLNNEGRVGLAHKRLSIIDLSNAAAQPMVSADGELAISFNGEIYNYRQLRDRLSAKGYQFKSESDTEVLLHLYRDMGEDMVLALRGMFAFAVWDGSQKKLFLARDPYGIKPLYVADNGREIRVASQVKALAGGGGIDLTQNPAAIAGFFLSGSVPEPHTLYRAIQSLPAGSSLSVTPSGLQPIRHYFSIAEIWRGAEQQANLAGDMQAEVRRAVQDSVKHHLIADVPVGLFLSAGIDSAALLGVVKDIAPTLEIQTVTLAFAEFLGSSNDEAPLAGKVAAHYGAKHHLRIVTRDEFIADLPRILNAMDQPSIDGINVWFISKAAKELGLKVAISGLGGDELFGGYPSFSDIPRWLRRYCLFAKMPLLGKLGCWLGRHGPKAINPKAFGLARYGHSFAGAWLLRRGIFMPWEKSPLANTPWQQGLQQLAPLKWIASAMGDTKTAYGKIAALEASLYMRNQLLRDADWAGMAHSVEIRLPLVDADLLKRLAPRLIGNQQAKLWLARCPLKPLPDEIVQRAKTGFTTPIRAWLTNALGEGVKPAANEHWSRAWARKIATEFQLN